MDKNHWVIAISSISGGGKTTVVDQLLEILDDAVGIYFDDYETPETYPEDPAALLKNGADFNVIKTPLLAQHLQALRRGEAVLHPKTGELVKPARLIIYEGPLGRAQRETSQCIDYLVFIDTPLEVGLARRISRGIVAAEIDQMSKEQLARRLKFIGSYADDYIRWVRKVYQAQYEIIKPDSDLVLDWELSPKEQAQAIIEALRQAEMME